MQSLIRPQQIHTLPYFPDGQKDKYFQGLTKLWHTLENKPKDSPEYQNTYDRLVQVSTNIKNSMQVNKAKSEAAARQSATANQQNAGRPMSSGQQGQPDARPLHVQPVSHPQTSEQKMNRELNVIIPPAVAAQGPDYIQHWRVEMKQKYMQYLQRFEQLNTQLNELELTKSRRENQGRPFSQQEAEAHHNQRSRLTAGLAEAKDFITKFQQQQKHLQSQQNQQIQSRIANAGENADQSRAPNTHVPNAEHNQGQHQTPQEPLSQPHTVSSALDAARNHQSPGAPSTMSPQNAGQITQTSISQTTNPRPQMNQSQFPNSHPPLNINTSGRPPEQRHNSPHLPSSQPTTGQEPMPLSQQAAIEHARSYTSTNNQQSTPQSATHAHPVGDPRNQRDPSNNHAKMPIPKDLNLAPPQPVSMGSSRPTLTNGPIAIGPMGQPAIQKHPGYVLEGEGERVLGKKKLEELVRQVTGCVGGEGEESEGLTAEVEEVSLSLFIYTGSPPQPNCA